MRFLILSDIHSNLEALNTVLEYAPDSMTRFCAAATSWVMGRIRTESSKDSRNSTLASSEGTMRRLRSGLVDLSLFNPLAKRAALWTQDELKADNRNYLKQIQAGPLEVPPLTLVHGSLLDEDSILSTWRMRYKTFLWPSIRDFLRTYPHPGWVCAISGRSSRLIESRDQTRFARKSVAD